MNHIGDFMGVPVYSDPSVPKDEMLIINDNDFKGAVGLKLKKRVDWSTIAFWAFIALVIAATFSIWMWALVWSWA